MSRGKHMAKQPDCTTSISSTQHNGIHGIYFGQYTTFNRFNHLASKPNHGWINIWGIDWTTTKLNRFNQQICCERYSRNSVLGWVIIVGLMIIHLFSEHYTTWIFPNVYSCDWHISQFRSTPILIQCAVKAQKDTGYTARWTRAIGGGIRYASSLREQKLCQSLVHPTRLNCPILRVISIPGHTISQLLTGTKISTRHQKGWLDSPRADHLTPTMCQQYWSRMAFRSWNSSVPSPQSWSNWFWLDVEVGWWIPETMIYPTGFLGCGLSWTSHDCSSLIWHMPDVGNS